MLMGVSQEMPFSAFFKADPAIADGGKELHSFVQR
jgi:hypothetical protein